MYKYNLYDNGTLVAENVRPRVITKMLGINHSRISNLVETGVHYKKRYRIERIEEKSDESIATKKKNKKIGEKLLKEWDEVTLRIRRTFESSLRN